MLFWFIMNSGYYLYLPKYQLPIRNFPLPKDNVACSRCSLQTDNRKWCKTESREKKNWREEEGIDLFSCFLSLPTLSLFFSCSPLSGLFPPFEQAKGVHYCSSQLFGFQAPNLQTERNPKGLLTCRWGPWVGQVTCLGWVTHLSIWSLILIWSCLHDRWGDPPRVTSPTWGPPPPCKQALSLAMS